MIRVAALFAFCLATACNLGSVAPVGAMDGGGGGGGGGDGGLSPTVCVGSGSATTPHQHTTPLDATIPSNAGAACLSSGCHLDAQTTGTGPQFDLAGTVYTAGGSAYSGANVVLFPDSGDPFLVADIDTDGNFYVYHGSFASFPAKTVVSACPDISPMTDELEATGGGNCNNCHATGSAAGSHITLGD